jgi:hypothetical protein
VSCKTLTSDFLADSDSLAFNSSITPLSRHQVRTHYSFSGSAVLGCLFFKEIRWKSIAAGCKPTLASKVNTLD